MLSVRFLPLAALFASFAAGAQQAPCPELPASSGLSWETMDGPDFVYCRAIRDSDGSQAFAVMMRAEPDFRARRSLRDGDPVVIDGQEVYWYRGDVPNALVRETLVEVDDGRYAHIVLRAASEDQLAEARLLAESLRFRDVRLGSTGSSR